jgi:hypothetical protein
VCVCLFAFLFFFFVVNNIALKRYLVAFFVRNAAAAAERYKLESHYLTNFFFYSFIIVM